MPRNTFVVPRILWASCLAVLYHMNTSTDNSSHLPSIRSSPFFHVFHNSLRNTIWYSRNPSSLMLLKFLPSDIMVNSLYLVIFVGIICHRHIEHLIRCIRECSQWSVATRILPFGSDVLPNMSWFSANQTLIDCPSNSILLTPLLIRAFASDPPIWKS